MRGVRSPLYLVVARPSFEYDYWLLAENIIHHGTLGFEGVPTTRFDPAYPLLIAGLPIVFRDHVFPAHVVRIVTGSLGAV